MHALTQFYRGSAHPFNQRDKAESTSDVFLAPLRFIAGQKVNVDHSRVYKTTLTEKVITLLVSAVLFPLFLIFTLVGTIALCFSKTHSAKCSAYFPRPLDVNPTKPPSY